MSQSQDFPPPEGIDDVPDDFDWEQARLLGEDLHVACDDDNDDFIMSQTQPVTQPEQVLIDEQQTREKFNQFCHQQVFRKVPGWDVSSKLPWGKDKHLDTFLENLNISKRKASTWWLELRRSRGCYENIEVKGSINEFKDTYNSTIKELVPCMCEHAWSCLRERFHTIVQFRKGGDVKKDFEYLTDLTDEVNALLHLRVLKYNSVLAENIIGMSPANKSSRLASFQTEIWNTRSTSFLTLCRSHFPNFRSDQNLRHFFVILDMELFNSWNSHMNEKICVPTVNVLHEEDIESVVCNSSGVLYYIAGWLLHRLVSSTGPTGWRNISSSRLFVHHNSLTSDSPLLHSLPNEVLERREKHAGSLKRVGKHFFRFMCILECLYKINLESKDAVWFYGDEILQRICNITKNSGQLDDAFNLCCPEEVPLQDRQAILFFILDKYRNVRAKDFVRLLKRSHGGADNIQFRQSVLVTHLMAKGKTPSALGS